MAMLKNRLVSEWPSLDICPTTFPGIVLADNRIISPGVEVGAVAGRVECRGRLGGILRYYHRTA